MRFCRGLGGQVTYAVLARRQKHYDELFPPLPDPSPSTLATSALYLAKRDQSHYTSLGQQSAWTDTKLSGFRLTASAGDRGRYWKSIELGAAPKKGQDPSEATASAVVQVGPAASGLEEAFDVRLAGDAEALFTDVVASEDAPLATSPHAVTVNAHLAEHLARVDIVTSPPSALTSGALPAGETLHVFNTAEQYAGAVEVKVPSWMSKVGTAGKAAGAQSGAGGAKAPMRASPFAFSINRIAAHILMRDSCFGIASKIVQVFVTEGQEVEEGAPLVAVEAMKTVRSIFPLFLNHRPPRLPSSLHTGARSSRSQVWQSGKGHCQRGRPGPGRKGARRVRGGGSGRGSRLARSVDRGSARHVFKSQLHFTDG